MNTITTEKYWDCECKENYIRSKNIRHCFKCGAIREEQPNSIKKEVEKICQKLNK